MQKSYLLAILMFQTVPDIPFFLIISKRQPYLLPSGQLMPPASALLPRATVPRRTAAAQRAG